MTEDPRKIDSVLKSHRNIIVINPLMGMGNGLCRIVKYSRYTDDIAYFHRNYEIREFWTVEQTVMELRLEGKVDEPIFVSRIKNQSFPPVLLSTDIFDWRLADLGVAENENKD